MTKHTAYIGIGSNLGNPAEHVRAAVHQLIQLQKSTLVARSSLYRTAPVDADGDDYVNAVVCLQTTLSPEILMNGLHELEKAAGRKRAYRNAPRTLDLDILLYDDREILTSELTLPHPRMTERAFVLIPLLEISPAINIPGKGAARLYLEQVRNQSIMLLTT